MKRLKLNYTIDYEVLSNFCIILNMKLNDTFNSLDSKGKKKSKCV